MRSLICVVIMLALISLTGCANNEPAPVEQSETEPSTIATEDFESGETEAMVEGVEEAVEEEAEEEPDSGDQG